MRGKIFRLGWRRSGKTAAVKKAQQTLEHLPPAEEHEVLYGVLALLRLKMPAAEWNAVDPRGAYVQGVPTRRQDRPGISDIVGCHEALYVGIEIKTENDTVRQAQGEHGNRVQGAKGLAVVIHADNWLRETELLIGLLTQTTHIVPNWPHYTRQLNLDLLQWPYKRSTKPAGGSSTPPKHLLPPG